MKALPKVFSAFLVSILLLAGCQRTIEADLVIKDINVIDVETGDVLASQDVIIEGETISSIQEHNESTHYIAPRIVDGRDKFLIPGLWDMHVHLFDDGNPNLWKLKLMSTYGITGVREMYILPNAQVDTVKAWNRATEERKRVLPRVGAVGTLVDGDPPVFSNSDVVTTQSEARAFVSKLKAAGVDFVKTYENLSKESFDALTEEAHNAELYIAGHVPKSISIGYASDAGLKSLEHFFGLSLASSHHEDSLRAIFKEDEYPTIRLEMMSFDRLIQTYDSVKSKRLIEKLAQNKTYMVPNLVLLKNWMNGETIQEIEGKFDLEYVPSDEYSDWQFMRDFKQYAPSGYQDSLKAFYQHQKRLLLEMQKSGVPILAGTDDGNPYIFTGQSLHEELVEMVDAGLTTLDALKTATLNPAAYFDKTEVLGTIETGKYADLVILDANPLNDINNIKTTWGTVINGQLFDRNELDGMLAEVKTEVMNKE